MRFILLSIIILSSLFCTAQQQTKSKKKQKKVVEVMNAEDRQKEAIGKAFPSFAASNSKGNVNNDSLKGKVVFINIWFEACPPCIAEMQALNDLFFTFKTDSNFRFVSFTYDNQEAIDRVKSKFDLDFPIYSISESECYRLNQNNGFPTSIILDKNGIIQFFKSGGFIESKIAAKDIEQKVYPVLRKLL